MGNNRSGLVNLNLVQTLSEWEAEDFLSSLLSPAASLSDFSSSDSCLVLHDHTYSLSQQHVSIDLGESQISEVWWEERLVGLAIYTFPFADGGNYGKEGAQTTPLRVEEPAEQVVDLWRDYSHIAGGGGGFPFPF